MPYTANEHLLASAGVGFSNPTPGDARSMFYDNTVFKYRDFQNTAEVLAYLNTANKRFGHFPIYVHVGGSLAAGVWTGGTTDTYVFKDGVTDGDLVLVGTGGSTTYAGLTDAATVALPTVNTPLSTALGLKAPLASPTFTGTVSGITKTMVGLGNVDNTTDLNKPISTATQTALDLKVDIVAFTTLVGDTWNIGTQPLVYQAITTDTDYTLAGGTNGISRGILIIDKTGTGEVTVDGDTYDTRDNGRTAISVVKLPDASYYVSTDYTRVTTTPDTTAPSIVSLEAFTGDSVEVELSEPWIGTFTGFGIRVDTGGGFGSLINATGITGTGSTRTLTFPAASWAPGDDLNLEYDDSTGNIEDLNSNALVTFTGEVVTNSYVADLVDPEVVSMEAIDANTIEVTFDEIVDFTDETGWDFDNGAPLTISGMTGTGTLVATFTIVETMTSSDTITGEYDETTGNVEDQATPTPNRLQSFGPDSVTNSITPPGSFPVFEDFEAASVGTVPTGFAASAGSDVVATTDLNGAQAFNFATGGTVGFLTYTTSVAPLATTVSCLIRMNASGFGAMGPMQRANSSTPASITDCYVVKYGYGSGSGNDETTIYKVIGGSYSVVATVVHSTGAPTVGGEYKITYTISAAHLHTVTVQDSAGTVWLDNTGTFVGSPANVISITDSSISTPGYAGAWGTTSTPGPIYIDDLNIS